MEFDYNVNLVNLPLIPQAFFSRISGGKTEVEPAGKRHVKGKYM